MNVKFRPDNVLISQTKRDRKTSEGDFIMAVCASLVIFLSFDNFFLIIVLATKFISKVRRNAEIQRFFDRSTTFLPKGEIRT